MVNFSNRYSNCKKCKWVITRGYRIVATNASLLLGGTDGLRVRGLGEAGSSGEGG